MTVFEAFTLDLIMTLVKAGAAMSCVWGTLRLLDKAAGVSFKSDYLPKILDGNLPVSLYCTGRFASGCYLYASLFGLL